MPSLTTNSLTSPARRDLHYRLNLQTELTRRASSLSPAAFRRVLRISSDTAAPLADLLQPWQHADFAALDPAWQHLAFGVARPDQREGRGGDIDTPRPSRTQGVPPKWRVYIERPRGHAKTSDMAAQLVWILLFSPRRLVGLAAAADRDQASLIRSAIEHLVRLNPQLCDGLEFRQHAVINPRTGSRLDIISSDVNSSWGVLPDFVICDELCHWEQPELWQSLFSSAAKKPRCLLAVLTNAGVGRGWQWQLREAARQDAAWHFSSLIESQAPWITPANLDEQRRLLPTAVFDRLWRNLWQDSGGEFVTRPEVEACRDESLHIQSRGEPHRTYIAAVDYAEKHDLTVGVVIHREGDRLIVDRMDVARPQPDAPVKVAWVEEWIARVAAAFPPTVFVLDEWQLLGTIQKFEGRYDIRRFAFLGGAGNHALALNLRKLIVHRDVRWYANCGAVDGDATTPGADAARLASVDNLETELASLVLQLTAAGRCRIDHLQDGVHHDDRAFALGAACLHAMQTAHDPDWLHVGGEFTL